MHKDEDKRRTTLKMNKETTEYLRRITARFNKSKTMKSKDPAGHPYYSHERSTIRSGKIAFTELGRKSQQKDKNQAWA